MSVEETCGPLRTLCTSLRQRCLNKSQPRKNNIWLQIRQEKIHPHHKECMHRT